MKEEKKQKKFHDALLKMLYPPQEEKEEEEEHTNKLIEPLYHLPEDLEIEENNESSSCSKEREDGDLVSEKPTRAQRKRLRKKKLKEAASQRRKIIGPLLPSSIGDSENVPEESVRQNAALEPNTTTDSSGEPASCSKSNKLKQRRKSKKLNSSNID
ncbi:hypothetical protein ACJIZ3_002085 [Penstemon smallii]|uniref:Uncharacterized protein n=1 Tax=Penstemon smallii TaxID=265156 RepID=A0ABD3U5I6_9LAMI